MTVRVWTTEDDALHERIVDQLRRAGWERWEAIEEADRLTSERINRERPEQNGTKT